jgi:hypothetical protein
VGLSAGRSDGSRPLIVVLARMPTAASSSSFTIERARRLSAFAYAIAGIASYLPFTLAVFSVEAINSGTLVFLAPGVLLAAWGALAGYAFGPWYLDSAGLGTRWVDPLLVPVAVAAIAFFAAGVCYGLLLELEQSLVPSFGRRFDALHGTKAGLVGAALYLSMMWWVAIPCYGIASWTMSHLQHARSNRISNAR